MTMAEAEPFFGDKANFAKYSTNPLDQTEHALAHLLAAMVRCCREVFDELPSASTVNSLANVKINKLLLGYTQSSEPEVAQAGLLGLLWNLHHTISTGSGGGASKEDNADKVQLAIATCMGKLSGDDLDDMLAVIQHFSVVVDSIQHQELTVRILRALIPLTKIQRTKMLKQTVVLLLRPDRGMGFYQACKESLTSGDATTFKVYFDAEVSYDVFNKALYRTRVDEFGLPSL
jgi:hypothetical protein